MTRALGLRFYLTHRRCGRLRPAAGRNNARAFHGPNHIQVIHARRVAAHNVVRVLIVSIFSPDLKVTASCAIPVTMTFVRTSTPLRSNA